MSRHRRRFLSVAVSAALALSMLPLASAAAEKAERARVPFAEITVTTTQVATGLRRPNAIAGLPDGRLLIAEKAGTVRAYHPDTGLGAEPLLDIQDRVNISGNERGLLGIVAAPNFAQTSQVYIAYTALPAGTLTLSRIQLGNPASEQVILTQPHAEFSNHNGGQVTFGQDGYLYWSLGDGGSAGDPFASGQDLSTLLGKIVRIDVSPFCQNGGRTYCVPPSNPYVGVAGPRPEIWAWGLRNAWRFSIDQDNSLWIGDVGQGTREEIDHVLRGGTNLGWSCREGTLVFNAERCDANTRYTDPVFEYQSSVEGCSVIGGHVYRGQRFADLVGGTYIATDYCSNTGWAVRANSDGTHTGGRLAGEFPIQVTSFGVDAGGEFYVINDLPGRLYTVSFEQVPAS